MIVKANAVEIFQVNIDRTNMLIEAIDKIKAYNWLYQQNVAKTDPHFLQTISEVQNDQLVQIGQSCAEHAIISLSTVFETYYSELLQELLFSKPDYFTDQVNTYTQKLDTLINDTQAYTFEAIEKRLGLRGRKDYYQFFQSYNVPFITENTEQELIEFIYAWRNHFVHNANRPDPKRDHLLSTISSPIKETSLITQAKRLRTALTQLIPKIEMRVKAVVYK